MEGFEMEYDEFGRDWEDDLYVFNQNEADDYRDEMGMDFMEDAFGMEDA